MQNVQNRRVPQTRPPTQTQQRQRAPASSSLATVKELRTNRGMIKFFLLTIITLGIYAIVFYSILARDLNTMASPNDGRKTMPYWAVFLITLGISIVTGIVAQIAYAVRGAEVNLFVLIAYAISYVAVLIIMLAWFHRMSNRVGDELRRRYIRYSFDAGTYWIWYILGSFIIVGPLIYMFKLCKAMNFLCEDFNTNGR